MLKVMQQKRRSAARQGLLVALFMVVALSGGESQKREEAPLAPGEHVLWADPGDPASLDFRYGAGGPDQEPQPPFHFLGEDLSGTTPKVKVKDNRGLNWSVKWGEETSPSTFTSRLVWACGYFVQAEYFVPNGRIEDTHDLKRADRYISKDGSFNNARFQIRADFPKYLAGQSWTWTKNPFIGTREFQGLKILLLLVSNWDAKDARNTVSASNGQFLMDSNLSILEDTGTGGRRYLYFDEDWGASMGKWGNFFKRSKWDCEGFAEQTENFLQVRPNGEFKWGFEGKHKGDLVKGIDKSGLQWLLQFLGKITDEQIRTGLAASGATAAEVDCFSKSLRARINQLKHAAGDSPSLVQ
jgi:hypothetical protein